MWPFSKKNMKRVNTLTEQSEVRKVNTLGYGNDGVVLALRLQPNGDLQILVDTRGYNEIVPMQKPASVYVLVAAEHVPLLQEWIAGIEGNVTYVRTDTMKQFD